LQREFRSDVPFRSVVVIDENCKNLAAMEYLGAEVDEAERQRDISENPHLCVWHNFTFDWIYDQQST